MKKLFFLAAVVCLSAVAGFSQAKPTDFSGTWNLDLPNSKPDLRTRVESMAMTVTQSATDLKVSTETKRMAPPTDAPAGAPAGTSARSGGGMGRGGGDNSVTYSLGKETTGEVDGPNGKMPVKYKASIDGGKANLWQSRTFNGPNGEVTMTTKEVWTLSADGKTLTIERENTSPCGTNTSTLIFVKK